MGYALVTGASKGIGKAIATELAKRKYDILLAARSPLLLKETAAGITNQFAVKTDYLAIDLSEPRAAYELYDWCKKNNYTIEILVNNAGYGLSGPFEKYTMEEYTALMQINMNTLVILCYFFLPDLKKLQKAFILNIASTTAYQSIPGLALYAASKSFVLSFSRALAYELHKTSVSVTCICPGSTDTDFVNQANMSIKTIKAADKFNMTPEAVAFIAVNAMLKKKTEVIAGALNKFGRFLVWLLPKKFIEKKLAAIYDMKL
jgi:uncharacterized protein